MKYYASIETGGTKCICSVGKSPTDMLDPYVIATTTPEETLPKLVEYFRDKINKYKIEALGIASFGPIDIHKESPLYGYITTTPKPGWHNADLVGTIKRAYPHLKIAFDTDVNVAALAEGAWGSAQGLRDYVYITIGTGIGVGVIANGEPIHGALHPEGGHMLLPIHPDDPSKGFCPYHGHCFEGLANGPSFDKRWNKAAAEIPDEHLAWDLEAHYIASGLVNIVALLSSQRIVIGGGISKRASLFPRIRKKTAELLNGYIKIPEIIKDIDKYIVPASLENSGLLGGLIMASKL